MTTMNLGDKQLRTLVSLSKLTPSPSEVQQTLAAMAEEILALRFRMRPMPGDADLAEKAAVVFLAHFVAEPGGVQEKARVGFNAGLPVIRDHVRQQLADLNAEVDKLAKFKAYVHERLDKAGVPKDPPSQHQAEGCRIGGRLDWLLARIEVGDAYAVAHLFPFALYDAAVAGAEQMAATQAEHMARRVAATLFDGSENAARFKAKALALPPDPDASRTIRLRLIADVHDVSRRSVDE